MYTHEFTRIQSITVKAKKAIENRPNICTKFSLHNISMSATKLKDITWTDNSSDTNTRVVNFNAEDSMCLHTGPEAVSAVSTCRDDKIDINRYTNKYMK